MSDHDFAKAPFSKKPYVRISYYDYQEWLDLLDDTKLTRWEMLRLKTNQERLFYGRLFLQVPLMAASYWSAHVVLGPVLRRRDAGFREMFIFSSLFYVLYGHFVDQKPVPDRFLDELLTQKEPGGDYVRGVTQKYHPLLWKYFKEQLNSKGCYPPVVE